MNEHERRESIALGGLLQLLGRLLCEELNPELLAILRQPDVREIFIGGEDQDAACARYLAQTWNAEAFEKAATDYCELFVLPKGISPLAAAWQTSNPAAEQAVTSIPKALSSITANVALTLPPAIDATPPEHAGRLLFIGGQLACSGDPEIAKLARPFLQATAMPWLERFAGTLASTELSPFYGRLGEILHQTCDHYLATS